MKTFDEIYQLNEVLYNARKIYYHISPNRFNKFEKRNAYRTDDSTQGGVFLSPNPLMLREYAKDYLLDHYPAARYWLYRCKLSNNVDIFNPSVRPDRESFIDVVKSDPTDFIRRYASHSASWVQPNLKGILQHIFFGNNYENMENPAVVKVISALGFDGLEMTENNIVNMLVFDPSHVAIIDDNPWKQIGSSTIDRDFDKLFGSQLDTEHHTRTKLELSDDLAAHKLEDVFLIDLIRDGKVIDSLDYSGIFDSRGDINKRFLDEMLLNANLGVGGIKAEYQGHTYATGDELTKALEKDYKIT
jgi:hypothetical protein